MKIVLPFCLCAASVLAAQGEHAPKKQDPKQRVAAAKTAVEGWIRADVETRQRTIKATVKKLMAAGKPGLQMLRKELDAAKDDTRLDRLLVMVEQVAHRWLIKVEKSEMVFAGQYDGLKILLPEIGEFYLRLLLVTPQWFPINERTKVVAPLRDLYPKGPDRVQKDSILLLAEDEDEPESLRVLLAQALAQWGNRKLIKTRLQALQKKARSDDSEIAVLGLRELARVYYDIRDYHTAAVTYRDFTTKAESFDDSFLEPAHYYTAACCMCLSGDKRLAWEFVNKSLALNKSSRIDSSVRLKRKLFEKDPEIGLLRKDPRFGELLDKAFGKKGKAGKQSREPQRRRTRERKK